MLLYATMVRLLRLRVGDYRSLCEYSMPCLMTSESFISIPNLPNDESVVLVLFEAEFCIQPVSMMTMTRTFRLPNTEFEIAELWLGVVKIRVSRRKFGNADVFGKEIVCR